MGMGEGQLDVLLMLLLLLVLAMGKLLLVDVVTLLKSNRVVKDCELR